MTAFINFVLSRYVGWQQIPSSAISHRFWMAFSTAFLCSGIRYIVYRIRCFCHDREYVFLCPTDNLLNVLCFPFLIIITFYVLEIIWLGFLYSAVKWGLLSLAKTITLAFVKVEKWKVHVFAPDCFGILYHS